MLIPDTDNFLQGWQIRKVNPVVVLAVFRRFSCLALGFVILLSGGNAMAQTPLSSGVGVAPSPKLVFSQDEMWMAEHVAGDPGLAEFYGAREQRPVFLGPEAAARREALFTSIATAPQHGLPVARYDVARLRALDMSQGNLESELEFARGFARWARELSRGMLDPNRVDPEIKRKILPLDLAAVLRDYETAADPVSVLEALAPQDPAYAIFRRELATLPAPVASNLPKVPVAVWKSGARGEGVAILRARLSAAGFDAASPEPALFDASLTDAVTRYQDRAGLPADGVAGPQTLSHLNDDGEGRRRNLLISMERLRWLNGHDRSGRHIWVNLPEYQARVFDGTEIRLETRVVVGADKEDFRTPEFSDLMRYVVANPFWNVPRSISVRDYLPRLKQNRNALSHLDVIDRAGNVVSRDRIDFSRYTASSFPYRLRQKPSDDNALGLVKFMFPNPYNIYLHDTPSKGLFSHTNRAYSNGCIRIADPMDLAYELLRPQTDDPQGMFQRALAGGKERWLTLTPGIPIHLVYFTSWPDQNGKIRHYSDIYGRDDRVWTAMTQAGTQAD